MTEISEELHELLERWEDAGRPVDDERLVALCGDQPQLLDEFRRCVNDLLAIEPVLGGADWAAGSYDEGFDAECVQTVSDFDVVGKLASSHQGGMGDIFSVRDRRLGREAALKLMRGRPSAEKSSRQRRFEREIEITGSLDHPSIPSVYGVGQAPDGRAFFVMRLVRGESAAQAIKHFHAGDDNRNPFVDNRREFLDLLTRFVTVCHTIQYAHSRQVIHRDIKPQNIMFGQFGETAVIDWGLAKQIGDTDTLDSTVRSPLDQTQMGDVLGTPGFLSPEQAVGDFESAGPATDVFSLGATLYMILTGRPPYEPNGSEHNNLTEQASKAEFAAPRTHNRQIPRQLESICQRAMHVGPANRYARPQELADDVQNWMADTVVQAHTETLVERFQRWWRRHRAAIRTAESVSAIFVLTFAILYALAYRAEIHIGPSDTWEVDIQSRFVDPQHYREEMLKNRVYNIERSYKALQSLFTVSTEPSPRKRLEELTAICRRILDGVGHPRFQVADPPEEVERSLRQALTEVGDLRRQPVPHQGSVASTQNHQLLEAPADESFVELEFSPDGQLLAATSTTSVTIYACHDGIFTQQHRLNHDKRIVQAGFSPDSRWIVVVTQGDRDWAFAWDLSPLDKGDAPVRQPPFPLLSYFDPPLRYSTEYRERQFFMFSDDSLWVIVNKATFGYWNFHDITRSNDYPIYCLPDRTAKYWLPARTTDSPRNYDDWATGHTDFHYLQHALSHDGRLLAIADETKIEIHPVWDCPEEHVQNVPLPLLLKWSEITIRETEDTWSDL